MLLPTCPSWPYLQGRGMTRDLTPLLKSFKLPWAKIKECCHTNLSKRLSLYSCHAPSNFKCRNIVSLPVTDVMSSNPAWGLLLRSQTGWNSQHTKSSIFLPFSDAPLMAIVLLICASKDCSLDLIFWAFFKLPFHTELLAVRVWKKSMNFT